jgi:outer membrane protein
MRLHSKRVVLWRVSWAVGFMVLSGFDSVAAEANPSITPSGWISQPLSLIDCLNLALTNNSAIVKSKYDLESTHGLAVQTRAVALPKLVASAQYQAIDANSIDKFPIPAAIANFVYPQDSWSANVTLRQTIYGGGAIRSALRSSKLLQEQALFQHQAIVADALLAVRLAYYAVLLAEQQIVVQEASISLLTKQLQDTPRRFDAGTVPRFNVLQAQVELANTRPKLSHAKNAFRISKDDLVHLLGYTIPKEILEDVPLQLTDKLVFQPFEIQLPAAIDQAQERRPELGALRQAERLQQETVVTAKSGYKPSVQLKGGYGSRNSSFREDLSYALSGWFAGAEASWNLFDGLQTMGKIQEAKALTKKAHEQLADRSRLIELEVRTAFSSFIEAKEIYDSQKLVQEQAEESLRLANARYEAGTGTQLDSLSAQRALTEARTTLIQALHDYTKCRAQLERAIGLFYGQDASANSTTGK